MALSEGTKIGPYEVIGLIGQGGMGEVWQARDTKLDRDVALKVLPEAFTSDPDRLARFEREAKVLASLNHPNIGSIYGLEEAEGVRALVLELVEGPTLADRIKQGPIPIDEALPIAKQIAEALEAAHEQGVIHRDLKPANIKVKDDGTVKVLDFGLAKAFQPEASGASPSESPTISLTAAATQMGMVIGTAAYMAPEQASGKTVDKRADVWAFGVVLYEMLTGARPFVGDDVSKTLAHVIAIDPDWSALPKNVPPVLGSFLRGCLEKDPRDRLRDIGDVRLALKGTFETAVTTAPESGVRRRLLVWHPVAVAAAVLAALVLGGLAVGMVPRPEPADLMRFVITLPDAISMTGGPLRDLVISPDGTLVVYTAARPDGARSGLSVRSIDQLVAEPLRGGEGGYAPFVSPDSAWVGFLRGGVNLQKVSVFGGPPVTLTRSPSLINGASWGTDDQIIFGTATAGLFRVQGGGGEPEVLTTPDAEQNEASHQWPSIIPDREAVVFTVIGGGIGQLAVLDLDTREVTRLGLAGVSPYYVPTGHLVYAVSDGSVSAVPFDATSLEVTGTPRPLLEAVSVKGTGAANLSISDNGRLVYASSEGSGVASSLVWVDRDGREDRIDAPSRTYLNLRISPDGMRVAVDIRDRENDIWVWNLPSGPLTRLTFDSGFDQLGHWTPDGKRVVFSSVRGDMSGIYWKAADGTGTAERLPAGGSTFPRVLAVTPDGTRVLAARINAGRGSDLFTVTLDDDHTSETVSETVLSREFNERSAALSPDGAWLAYESNESGPYEVYVRPFPDVEAGKWQVSTAGGQAPLWSRDGTELFYRASNRLMVVAVQTDPSFSRGTPQTLFEGTFSAGYDISPDGRFLMIKRGDELNEEASSQVNIVLNWFEELKARVPLP